VDPDGSADRQRNSASKNIARDIVAHFEARQEVFAGKGMVVSMSRRIAAELYAEISGPASGLAFRPRPEQGGHQGGDDGLQSATGRKLAKHHTTKEQRKRCWPSA
jgi:type I restriction enzyme R subunit